MQGCMITRLHDLKIQDIKIARLGLNSRYQDCNTLRNATWRALVSSRSRRNFCMSMRQMRPTCSAKVLSSIPERLHGEDNWHERIACSSFLIGRTVFGHNARKRRTRSHNPGLSKETHGAVFQDVTARENAAKCPAKSRDPHIDLGRIRKRKDIRE